MVDFGSYRGCGAFVAEPVDVHLSDFWLHKTLEEMGYSLPLLFSDAPDGYYDEPIVYLFKVCFLFSCPTSDVLSAR